MSAPSVLYFGDTSLTGDASYLAGVMTVGQIEFDYVPSARGADPALLSVPRKLFILSDYPAWMIPPDVQRQLVAQVAQGAGLLMIGGWESFCGNGGNWAETAIAAALPAEISLEDDRLNCDQPALVTRRESHEMLAGLPWDERPPTIGGFNRITPKPDATVLLEVRRFDARFESGSIVFEATELHPLLITGQHGQGRTAALATDVAPHWVGGLVDWGTSRVRARAQGSVDIEVGDLYASFLQSLLRWTGRL